jgi:hypothetical protein
MPLFKRKQKEGQTSRPKTGEISFKNTPRETTKSQKAMAGRSISEKITYTDASGKKAAASFGMGNTKFKSYSQDKNYVTKGKTNVSGDVTKMKARRTVKGALTGAPRLKKNM